MHCWREASMRCSLRIELERLNMAPLQAGQVLAPHRVHHAASVWLLCVPSCNLTILFG